MLLFVLVRPEPRIGNHQCHIRPDCVNQWECAPRSGTEPVERNVVWFPETNPCSRILPGRRIGHSGIDHHHHTHEPNDPDSE
jgi:hypothetical protein